MILGDSFGLQCEMYYSEQNWWWWSPTPGWVPTFPGVLSMLCDGFLEFLRIVYDSFQRYTLVIFISCDVNWRIMLKGKRCTKNSLWSHSLWIMKNNYLYFFPQVIDFFFLLIWYFWDLQHPDTRLFVTWNNLFLTSETLILPNLASWAIKLKQARSMSREGAERCLSAIRRHNIKTLLNSCFTSGKHPSNDFLCHFRIVSKLPFTTWGLIFW